MVFSFLYRAVRALLGALVRSRRSQHVKDVEMLVLRHERRPRASSRVISSRSRACARVATTRCSSSPMAADASGLPAAPLTPPAPLVTQQARNLRLNFSEQGVRFLIRDRDSKYSGPFDEVVRSKGTGS